MPKDTYEERCECCGRCDGCGSGSWGRTANGFGAFARCHDCGALTPVPDEPESRQAFRDATATQERGSEEEPHHSSDAIQALLALPLMLKSDALHDDDCPYSNGEAMSWEDCECKVVAAWEKAHDAAHAIRDFRTRI